jgi:hypothetical protein
VRTDGQLEIPGADLVDGAPDATLVRHS